MMMKLSPYACSYQDKCGNLYVLPIINIFMEFHLSSRHKLRLQATPFTGPETLHIGP